MMFSDTCKFKNTLYSFQLSKKAIPPWRPSHKTSWKFSFVWLLYGVIGELAIEAPLPFFLFGVEEVNGRNKAKIVFISLFFMFKGIKTDFYINIDTDNVFTLMIKKDKKK